jgi:predicted  nucleic acid-binding Zn-ribbon protein
MTCPACTTARQNRYSGEYRSGCLGCGLRAFSRSQLAKEAHASRSNAELRAALATAYPGADVATLLKGVWQWWKDEHQSTGAA